jgi:hypothetical protein
VKKQKPFTAGDRVRYGRRTGAVLKCINARDAADVKIQGYRYEVSFDRGNELRSIPHHGLAPNMKFHASGKVPLPLGGDSEDPSDRS